MLRAILFASIFALSACSSVPIYDDPWCMDAGKFGAKCFNSISDKEFSLNKYEWDMLRVGQACTATEKRGEGYLHIKVPLEKLCADSRHCSLKQKDALKSASQKADRALEEAKGSPAFDNGKEKP